MFLDKAIITHKYIAKEYTKDNIPLYLGWTQEFNGKGCNLENKETISWNELKIMFKHNTFRG